MSRPTRPPGHPATCECFGCDTYWSLSLDYETEIMRQRHARDLEARRLALLGQHVPEKDLADYLDSPFAALDLEVPERRKVLLRHFREAWFALERQGFTTAGVHVEVVWAYKERAFSSAALKARDELGLAPHQRNGKALALDMTRVRLRSALLQDLAQSRRAGPAGCQLAAREAARLRLELDPRTGADL